MLYLLLRLLTVVAVSSISSVSSVSRAANWLPLTRCWWWKLRREGDPCKREEARPSTQYLKFLVISGHIYARSGRQTTKIIYSYIMILRGTIKCVPPPATGAQWVTTTDAGEHKTPRSLRMKRHAASIKLPHTSAERRAASISTWNWSPEYQCNITLRLRIGLKGAPDQHFSLERRLPHKIGKCRRRRWVWRESCHSDVISVISNLRSRKNWGGYSGCSLLKYMDI